MVRASPATFARGTFNRILIEGELAFRLRAPLAPDASSDPARVAAAVGELVVTIEVVDPRYRDMASADQGLNGALIVGTGMAYREPVAWSSLVAVVRRDGNVVKQTCGGHPLGNLLFLLGWLARHAAERGQGLAEGDVVTAGTWTGVVEATPGQAIEVEFPAVGRATARFE
jgi:2-keto-4-pentenoate hydratase